MKHKLGLDQKVIAVLIFINCVGIVAIIPHYFFAYIKHLN